MFRRWEPIRTAFEPPSDYVGSDGGSGGGKKKLWIFLGGGCLLVILAFALLFGAGAFKMVSCCNQFQDVAKRTVAAQNYGYEFASLVGERKVDEAYSRLSDQAQGVLSAEDFARQVEEYGPMLDASTAPRRRNMQARQTGTEVSDVKAWNQSYQFSGPKSTEMLVLSFEVQQQGEGETAAFEIAEVDFDVRPRNLAAEPPAAEVTEFHDELQQAGRLAGPMRQFHGNPRSASAIGSEARLSSSITTRAPAGTGLPMTPSVPR